MGSFSPWTTSRGTAPCSGHEESSGACKLAPAMAMAISSSCDGVARANPKHYLCTQCWLVAYVITRSACPREIEAVESYREHLLTALFEPDADRYLAIWIA